MEIKFGNAQIVLLFAILFVVVGHFAPVAFAAYAPQSHYVDVHEFSAQNTTTASDTHLICLDRTMESGRTGTAYTELYLVTEDGTRVEVDSNTMERYFQGGRHHVKTEVSLPNNLQAGEYKYMLVIKMDLAQGRVAREFAFTSQKFTIEESGAEVKPDYDEFSC